MPIIPIRNFGGIVKDDRPYELPPNVFSAGHNVRFKDGNIEKFGGHAQVLGTPSVAPYFALPVTTQTASYWLYAGLAKVYATDGSTHYNLTRQTGAVDVDYSATADLGWNGGILNSIQILNNGVDEPQMWNPISTAQRLQALSNWPASTTARVIRPFKYWLIALDVTKSGTRYQHLVKWSSAAEPGLVPATWDQADTTKDAGETPLASTAGFLVDCQPLGDVNFIYKEDSIHGMQWIGGNDVFRFWQTPIPYGMLTRRCAKEFNGKHLVLAHGDLIVHDGINHESIIDGRWKKWLFNTIDHTNYARSFITPNIPKSEMWICFPSSGSAACNMALVWNYKDNSFGMRELPGAAHIGYGVIDPSENQTWDADSEVWDVDMQAWDYRNYNPTQNSLLIASPTNTKLYQADNTEQFDGVSMLSYVERQGLALAGMDRQGNITVDLESIKFVRAIWPHISATNGTQVDVYVGSQMRIGDPVSWSGPFTFTVGTDYKIDCRVTGRLIAVKFQANCDCAWTLDGFDVDVDLRGRY